VRMAKFKDQIGEALAAGGLDLFRQLIEDYEREQNVPAIDIAAALAKMNRGDEPLLLEKPDREPKPEFRDERPAREFERDARPSRAREGFSDSRAGDSRFGGDERPARPTRESFIKKERVERAPEEGMATYRIEVGYANGAKPGNIVGAIANEGGIAARDIGRIEIYDDYATLDMPADLPQDLLNHLQKVWVAGRQLNITRDGQEPIKSAPKKKFGDKKPFRKS
jgi:ATP-dependent RNA helicase DeaD